MRRKTESKGVDESEAEEAMRKSDEIYRLLVENTSDYVALVDSKGRYIYVNPAHERLGYTRDELIGEVGINMVHPDDRPQVWSMIATYAKRLAVAKVSAVVGIKKEVSAMRIYYRFRDKSGSWHYIETTPDIIEHPSGRGYAGLLVSRDITERKRAEVEKDRLLKAIGTTAEGIAIADENDRYIYVNAAHARIYGYTQEELIGRTWREITPPEQVAQIEKVSPGAARSKSVFSGEISALRKDGTTVPTEVRATALWDKKNKYAGHVCVVRDITERKGTEEALRESEEKYRDLFENANDAICILDSDLNYTDANKKAVEMMGYSREELLNMNVWDVIPANQVPRSEVEFDKLRKKGSYEKFIGKVRTKDGRLLDVEISSSAIIKDGKVIGSRDIIRDITERKRMEEELRISEGKYRTLMDDASDAILLIDTQGNLRETNKKAEELLGYTGEELLKTHITQIYPKEELGRGVAAFKEVLLKGSGFLGDGLILRKDGKTVPVDITWGLIRYGEGVIVQGIFRDVTERKGAEEEIQERERFLTNIFSSIQDGISVLDSEFNILRINPAMERWYACSMPLVGKKCYQAYHSRSEPCEVCPSRRTIQTGEAACDVVPKRGAGGEIVGWLDLYSFPLIDKGTGRISGIIEYVRDITEVKRAEELRLENEHLTLANRTKSKFLATMSHELRTPLNSVIGFSELLKQRAAGGLNDKQEHYIDNVITSGKHLLGLINDILDLSKVEAGKIELVMERISVPAVINESILNMQGRAAKSDVLIKEELDPALDFIEADRQRLKQILFNLLSNAVKFSKPEGGTVTVSTKREGDVAKFSVSDTGIGIKEEHMGRLFGEFEQLEFGRKYGGTGLGLAISKKLVELHGGRITAQSKYGEGSTFTFLLPVTAKKFGENK